MNRAVVVAMSSMDVMQMTVHQVVDVVAVRHRFMTTAWTVHVGSVVTIALMIRCALGGVGAIDGERMLVDVALMGMV